MKKLLLLFFALVLVTLQTNAATYYLKTANLGAAQTASSWNTGGVGGGGTNASNFTTSGDIFIVSTGQTATFGASTTFGTGVTLQFNGSGTILISKNATINLTVNGTIIFSSTNTNQITFVSGGNSTRTFTLGSSATLITPNTNGISGTNCSLPVTNATNKFAVNLNTGNNYELNSTSAQQTLGLPTTVSVLTINNAAGVTLSAATTITTLTIGNVTANSIFNDGGFLISTATNLTISTTGTYNCTAATFPWGTASIGGTVNYSLAGSQIVANKTYTNLQISGGSSSVKTFAPGTPAVSGTLTIAASTTLDMGTDALTVTTISNSGIIKTSNTSSTPIPTGKTWGGTVNYEAATSQTVSSGTYNNLTFSGGGANTTTGVIVNGILSMEGTATASATPTYGGSATLQYKGSASQITGPEFPATAPSSVIIANPNGVTLNTGKSIGNLTINNSGVFNDGGFVITDATTLTMNSGTYNCNVSTIPWGTTNLTGGTINYNYAGLQTFPAKTYSSLTFSGSGIKTLGGDITVNGTLTINPLNNSTTLDAGNHIITITGPGLAWNNPNNSFVYGTSTVRMQGTNGQQMYGSTFYDLEINNAAGVTLTSSDVVTNQLTLTSGQLILNGNKLTLNPGVTLAGNGGNAVTNFNNSNSNYIVTGTGDYLYQHVASSDVIYPVGTATFYNPAILNNTGGTADNYGVYVENSTVHSFDVAGVVNSQWTIQEESPNLSNLIMTFQWNSAEEGLGFIGATTAAVGIWGGVTGPNFDVVDSLLTITGANPRSVKMSKSQMMDFSGSNARTYAIGRYNSALPVELSSFTSVVKERSITLNWSTSTEKNSDKFIVEKMSGSTWTEVGTVKAANLSNSSKQYSFTDKNLQAGKYQYRLKMIDNDGTFAYSKVTEAVVSTPKSFELGQNYPNPFNPSTRIGYQIPVDSKVMLEVYNIVGQRVAMIVNEEQSAGYYTVNFNSTSYRNITSGVYIYKLTAVDNAGKNSSSIKKMMLLK